MADNPRPAVAAARAAATGVAHAALERDLAVLAERKTVWARLPLARKIVYARSLLAGVVRVAPGQVEAAAAAKGVSADSPLAGEDWLSGPYVTARTLRLLISTLEDLRRYGEVRIDPERLRELDNGQLAVEVFPLGIFDRILFRGFRADVWLEPGVTRRNLGEHMAGTYREPAAEGAVALVLGAGNVASIAALDVVHKLFAEGRVVMLKLNPVNDYLGPFLEDAFDDLVRDGYLRLASGGAEVGSFLCHHPLVEEIHITGSQQTHDAIVFGAGPEGEARRRRGEPVLDKPITSELGNVSPVILVPGRWSRQGLRFHAANIATQMVQNGGFNCNATKVLVTHRDWPQRRQFLLELATVLEGLPPRPAYYPGAEERFERFRAAYPGSRSFGPRRPGVVPPTLATGVDAADAGQLAFREESFCAFSVETSLGGGDAVEFLEQAVALVNDKLAGTLNAGLIVDPATERGLGAGLERAIAGLAYGTVAINHWPAMGYALGSTPWGAFPGHTLTAIGSGLGVVHNTFLFDRPQKSVVSGPFVVTPKPPWFVTHRASHRVGEALTRFEADPGWSRLPEIFVHALRG